MILRVLINSIIHSLTKHLDNGLTSEDAFSEPYPAANGFNNYFAYISQPINYEKIGVRGQLSFDFGFGLGVVVKGGVVDVRAGPIC